MMNSNDSKEKLTSHIFFSFIKFANLVALVTREGNLNFEKNIRSINVNKDGDLYVHIEWRVS